MKKKVAQGVTVCLATFRKGNAAVKHGWNRFGTTCVNAARKLGTFGLTLWYFRQTCSIVLWAGLVGGVIGYFASPVISSMLCSLGGMTLSLSGMILLPLLNLARTSNSSV
jgi:hypothetical protein